ncbi:MAG: methionyl-tRNA formyltransferase, partial [Prolixibacteraceae bacterium]|nr:methionyl-tRNA formyltransferase [Prolixibacteraceae bacterium]
AIAGGNIQAVSQSELIGNLEIKHAPKIFKDDCKINWTEESESIRNQIRGLSPYPAAWTNLTTNESGQKIQTKIFFATKIELSTSAEPGTIKTDGKTFVNVACGNGWLQITDLQIAGKKRMKTEDFLRGFKNIEGHRFE